jgi:hypothetical protein
MKIPASDFEITVPSLLFDPEVYLFDFSGTRSKFLIVPENLQAESPFIDIRFEPFAQAQFSVATKSLFALEDQHNNERPKINFIFHHAFVCSTLLARCLNQSSAFFSLKEPWIFRRLADFKRNQAESISQTQWQQMFLKNTSLLAKNYHTGNSIVVKATNVANNLLEDVLTKLPDSNCLYLYSDLQSFLVSNLKKTSETQKKIPSLFHGFCQDSDFLQRFTQFQDVSDLSFLQICGLIWLINIYNFRYVVENTRAESVRTLDMSALLTDTTQAVAEVSSYFGHRPIDAEKALMTQPDLMNTNAKAPGESFNSDMKQKQTDEILYRYGSEIKQIIDWIDPMIQQLGLPDFLAGLALNNTILTDTRT